MVPNEKINHNLCWRENYRIFAVLALHTHNAKGNSQTRARPSLLWNTDNMAASFAIVLSGVFSKQNAHCLAVGAYFRRAVLTIFQYSKVGNSLFWTYTKRSDSQTAEHFKLGYCI